MSSTLSSSSRARRGSSPASSRMNDANGSWSESEHGARDDGLALAMSCNDESVLLEGEPDATGDPTEDEGKLDDEVGEEEVARCS